jgi:hypothetical protein
VLGLGDGLRLGGVRRRHFGSALFFHGPHDEGAQGTGEPLVLREVLDQITQHLWL